jgi:hypothetical protein
VKSDHEVALALFVAYGYLTYILCEDIVVWDVTPYGLMEVSKSS